MSSPVEIDMLTLIARTDEDTPAPTCNLPRSPSTPWAVGIAEVHALQRRLEELTIDRDSVVACNDRLLAAARRDGLEIATLRKELREAQTVLALYARNGVQA